MSVQYKPAGYHTVTPFICNTGIRETIDFAKAAFGAIEREVHLDAEGKIRHGEIMIGESIIMVSEASGDAAHPAMFYLYVEDCDAVYAKAVAAGGKSLREPTTEFYGDRSCGVVDSFGNQWWLGTHVEDVSAEELQRRMNEMGM